MSFAWCYYGGEINNNDDADDYDGNNNDDDDDDYDGNNNDDGCHEQRRECLVAMKKGRIPLPYRINGKSAKGGGRGVIFNPKIYVADFGNFLNRAFWPWNW